MKRDIETRADIEAVLTDFYKIVMFDKEIGHHFDDMDLESHLPIITDFWEKVLFGKPVYFNNPLTIHQRLHEKYLLKSEHFARWVEVFGQTVDRLFSGEMAELAKFRAVSIGGSLDQKLNGGVQIRSLSNA